MKRLPLAALVFLVLAGPPAAAVDPAGAVARPVARAKAQAVPAPRMDYVRVVDRPWQRVTITVTATDRRGRPVRGLQAADFRVTDAGQPVTLADFGPEEGRRDRPLSVAVLLDLSESMAGQVGKVEEAARALLAGLRPGDEVMVARFNHQLTILQPFTGRLPEGAGRLRDLGAASGGTALFHAISSTLLELRDRPGRKIVLVVSDGVDTVLRDDRPVLQSLYFQELVRLCFRTGTTVYGVRPGITSGNMAFEDFVEETGGRLVYTGEGLDRLFARLGEEFLSQYVLAWDADPKSFAAEWRRIQVDVRRPGVTIAALRGFLTPRGQVDVDLRHLADDEPGTRADAAWDLGFIDEPRVREALRGRLDDEDAGVRRRAAEALGRLRDPEARAPLAERLGDADPLVVEAAAAALEGFGPAAIGALAAACVASAAEPRRAAAAATVLGRVGDQRALEPLAALLASPAPEARLAAARAIADLGLVAGVGPLRGVLEDPDPGLRRAALRGIAGLAQEAARPILEDHLRREKDPAVREALMAMLEPAPRRAEPTR